MANISLRNVNILAKEYSREPPQFCAYMKTPDGFWNPAACGYARVMCDMFTESTPHRWIAQLVENYDVKSAELHAAFGDRCGIEHDSFTRVFNSIANHCEFWNDDPFEFSLRGIATTRAFLRAHRDVIERDIIQLMRDSAEWDAVRSAAIATLTSTLRVSAEAATRDCDNVITLIAHLMPELRATVIVIRPEIERDLAVIEKRANAVETHIDAIISRMIDACATFPRKNTPFAMMHASEDTAMSGDMSLIVAHRDLMHPQNYAQILARLVKFHAERQCDFVVIRTEITELIMKHPETRKTIAHIINGGYGGMRSRVRAIVEIVGNAW